MPEMTPKRQQKPPPFDVEEARRLYIQLQSYRKVAVQLDSNYQAVYRALNPQSNNGEVPAVHSDASERISALESIDSALLREIVARLEVVESFMLAQQSLTANASQRINASAHLSAPQRIWVNRGTHIAADMVEAIKGYAQQHRLEIREVLDLALRQFFAGEGSGDA